MILHIRRVFIAVKLFAHPLVGSVLVGSFVLVVVLVECGSCCGGLVGTSACFCPTPNTFQPFNLSTIQTFQPFNLSTFQPFNRSPFSPVVSVSLNGHDLGIVFTRYGIDSQSSTWTYCHQNIATVIHLVSTCAITASVSILFPTLVNLVPNTFPSCPQYFSFVVPFTVPSCVPLHFAP